jgi:hypothetical protein
MGMTLWIYQKELDPDVRMPNASEYDFVGTFAIDQKKQVLIQDQRIILPDTLKIERFSDRFFLGQFSLTVDETTHGRELVLVDLRKEQLWEKLTSFGNPPLLEGRFYKNDAVYFYFEAEGTEQCDIIGKYQKVE